MARDLWRFQCPLPTSGIIRNLVEISFCRLAVTMPFGYFGLALYGFAQLSSSSQKNGLDYAK